ncbi:unnamed protein product, partial [Discosporangium mesarthrocarpum]
MQCKMRWERVVNPGVKKGAWAAEEDQRLREALARLGHQHWNEVARVMDGRTYKQCRERYMNYLKDGLNTGEWTELENRILLAAHDRLGNKWATIASHLK